MTTLVALASKHAVVIGTDSLGTETRRLVDIRRLFQYFDPSQDFKLRVNQDGTSALGDFWQVYNESEHVPYNQLLHVNKLFKLGTLPVGVMFTGIASIGTNSVRGLIAAFTEEDRAIKQKGRINYTVNSIGQRLLQSLRHPYEETYEEDFMMEDLELLIAGYDRNEQWPTVLRVDVRKNTVQREFAAGEFGIAFGGQMDWIQRIVFGTDGRNRMKLQTRVNDLLGLYRQKIIDHLQSGGYTADVPEYGSFDEELGLFAGWELDGLQADWAEFSEQNAIDAVDFFLRTMIQAQDVSVQLPTVGGNVHIAVIRKDGFHPVTKEVWRHGDHEVPIPQVGR